MHHHTRGTFVARWRTEVFKTSAVPDSVKVLMLLLAEFMTERGYVSVPRPKLAELLGRHPSRVSERIDLAIKAGILDVSKRGYLGHTAQYQALLPGLDGYRKTVSIRRSKNGKHATPEWLPDGQETSSKRLVDASRQPQHVNGWERPALEESTA